MNGVRAALLVVAGALLACTAFGAAGPVKKSPPKPAVLQKKLTKAQAKTAKPAKAAPVSRTLKPARRGQVPGAASRSVQVAAVPDKAPRPPEDAARSSSDTPPDTRELVRMPSAARLALRAEMRDRMAALDSVMQLISAGKAREAGQIAQERLGVAVWAKQRKLPALAQPEPYLPPEMQVIALEGFKAASDFSTVALTGDLYTATALLPQLTGSCAHCHQAYRIR